ncbi:MAG TPA: efflux transporter outer membrane subunit [Allosphingosinicella sp.]|nr:efflux transporter outer membrane subunit [Allosphingosinicella sp.]
MKTKLMAVTLAALSAGACTVGPNYERPQVAQPDAFRSQIAPAEANSLADLPWWEVFNDPALQALIGEALTNNNDLAVAAARIEQARAQLGVSRSELYPQIGYGGQAGVEETLVPSPGNTIGTVNYGSIGGLLNAAWELDIWGRVRRQNEAAQANLFAQEEVRRGIMLSLVSDVAAGYFRLLRLDRELAIAEESAATHKRTLDLFVLRFQGGRDSRLPSERARASYESSTGQIAHVQQQIAQQENALSILTGGYPHDIQRGLPLTSQTLPATPVGLTTDLLRRRPDIRRAEQDMIRANAEVGVAVANFYPRIGLSSLLGAFGVDGDGNINGSFGVWNILGQLAGPIFTGGRLESQYDERKAFWDETIAQYRQTILVAFRETSDALVAQQRLAERRRALEAEVAARRAAVELANLRYRDGRATYFEVIEAEQQLFPAEDALAEVQQAQLAETVNLYKALGGGWQLRDNWVRPTG